MEQPGLKAEKCKSYPSKTQVKSVGIKIPTAKVTLREAFLASQEESYRTKS
jgi:hypothetical protein